jgi:hypothetical protein
MRARVLAALATAGLAGCAVSDDPAAGGFVSGVAGVAGGGYDARIAERETGLATTRAEGAALGAELAALEREHASLKDQLIRQRADLGAAGIRLTPESERAFQAAIATEPAQSDPAARAAALERAIADGRQLSEQLAALSS